MTAEDILNAGRPLNPGSGKLDIHRFGVAAVEDAMRYTPDIGPNYGNQQLADEAVREATGPEAEAQAKAWAERMAAQDKSRAERIVEEIRRGR